MLTHLEFDGEEKEGEGRERKIENNQNLKQKTYYERHPPAQQT